MLIQENFDILTNGRGTYELTANIQKIVAASGINKGLCHVFTHHTSASLILCENADRTVRRDLETFMAKIIPDGDPMFQHKAEGPDDMPAHLRTIMTQSGLNIPVTDGRCSLGTWQGIYLWEHRTKGFTRNLTVTIHG